MKVLFTASISGHLSGFHIPYLKYFKEKGFEVHTAANGPNPCYCSDIHYEIPFERNPLSLKNISCFRKLKKVIDRNGYDIIHCHTPVVGVLTRLAAKKARKRGTTVIYTAHGFHFYDGAPKLKAAVFRFAEKKLSKYTDHMITINSEDYRAVSRYGFKPKKYYKVPGVGVDSARFFVQTPETKRASREKNGIDATAFVLIFAGEYCRGKNQRMLIDAVNMLKEKIPSLLLLLAGRGPAKEDYEILIKQYGLETNVRLLGFRKDIDSLLQSADIAVSSSLREGLGINIVEALSVSLPVVATRIRGHIDLITEGENGYLVDTNAQAIAERILYLYENPDVLSRLSAKARESITPYLMPYAKEQTVKIYESIIRARSGHS